MKRSSYRTGLTVKLTGRAWGAGAVIRTVIFAAVLFTALTIIASVAVAQKNDEPTVPDSMNDRSDMVLGEKQETGGGAPETLRLYTVTLETNCSLDPLSVTLNDMLAAGRLKEAPLLKNNRLHIMIGEAYLDDLSALSCVQEIVPDGRDPQKMMKPDASSLEGVSRLGMDTITSTTATGSISGEVTDEESGLALPGITVQLYNYPGPETGWAPFTSIDTAADGTYSIADLPDGTYRIGFFDWLAGTFVGEFFDDVFNLNIAFNIPVAGGAAVQDKNAALSRPGQITGIVQDAVNGDLLEGIDVSAYKQTSIGWEKINSDTTGVDGIFVIDDLPSGLYSVRFDDAGGTYLTQFFNGRYFLQDSDDVEVSGGTTTSGVNAFLTHSAHITGKVTAEAGSAPIENIEVCALVFKDSHWESLSCDFTDSSGDYDVNNLPPGTYRVLFSEQSGDYNGEYFDDSQDLSGATDVIVTAGGIQQNINAALSSAGHIQGMVTAAVGGGPLMDIRVCALSFINFDWRSVTCDYTDAVGQYDLSRLPAAEYHVEFYDQTGRYVAEYFSDTPDVVYARNVSVAAGDITSNINAELAEYGKIRGNVTAEVGSAALENIRVCTEYVGSYSDYRSRCTFTATDGGYEVDDLYPGTYHVKFHDHTYTYVGEYYNNVAPEDSSNAVLVAGGQETVGIDAALARYGYISGTVTAEDGGAPLALIHVYAFVESSSGWTYAGRGDTNNNGEYEIGPLASGNYLVEYYDSTGFYMTEYFDDMLKPDHAGQVSVASGILSQGIDAALAQAITQDIALAAGWNMISSYVKPADPALDTLFEHLENDVVLLKNGNGEVYWPAYGINVIGDWNEANGYQVYMDSPATLRMSGAAILPGESPIDLQAGWNLVAYYGGSAKPPEQALASIVNQLYLAKDGNGDVYWPEFGINQFGDMVPGQGYKLYLLEPGILTYPDN